MKTKLKLGLTLFFLGFIGILTMLTVKIQADIPPEFSEFPPIVFKLLTLISPTIFLIIAVIIGILLYDKTGLTVPTISSWLKIEKSWIKFSEQLKFGILLGVLSGILIVVVSYIFNSSIPQEFKDLGDKFEPSVLSRFLYGGFTEELLMRFGLMTLFVWLSSKVIRKLNNTTCWVGIILSTLLFAFGHFPVVFMSVAEPSISLLTFVLLGNSITGIFMGWLYWKKGLEAAFIGHTFTHVVLVAVSI